MKTRKNIIYSLVIITSLMPYLYVFYDFGKIKFGIDHYVGFYPIVGGSPTMIIAPNDKSSDV